MTHRFPFGMSLSLNVAEHYPNGKTHNILKPKAIIFHLELNKTVHCSKCIKLFIFHQIYNNPLRGRRLSLTRHVGILLSLGIALCPWYLYIEAITFNQSLFSPQNFIRETWLQWTGQVQSLHAIRLGNFEKNSVYLICWIFWWHTEIIEWLNDQHNVLLRVPQMLC